MGLVHKELEDVIPGILSGSTCDGLAPRLVLRVVISVSHSSNLEEYGVDAYLLIHVKDFLVLCLLGGFAADTRIVNLPDGGKPGASEFLLRQGDFYLFRLFRIRFRLYWIRAGIERIIILATGNRQSKE